MSRKSKSNAKLLNFGMIVAGVLALIALFLPAFVVEVGDSTTAYTGLNAVMGYTSEGSVLSIKWFEFSIMNLLTYILIIAGVLLTLLNTLGKSSSFFALIAAASFIVAAVFMFLVVNFTVIATVDAFGASVEKVSRESMKLGYGAIIGGILSGIAGLIGLYSIVKK